jgi:hypothetical protein
VALILRFRFAALICLALFASAPRADYGQWSWSRDILFNTSPSGAAVASDQTGFPVLIILGSQEADVFTQSPAHADLRFAKPDGTPLPFQVESWDATAHKAEIWVGMDTVKGGRIDQKIRMYWGRAGALDSSSGKAVFGSKSGYLGVWHMEAGIPDASVNAIAATDSGTSAEAGGRIGAARRFENPEAYATSGKYIALGNPAALNIAGKITFEAWIKWARRDGHRIVICHGSAPGSAFETVLRVGETRDYRAGVWTGSAHYAALEAPAVDSNAWVHLAGVYTGSAWILYRNGAKAAETPVDSNGAKPSPGAWRIGAEYAGSVTRFFHGAIDEVRVSGAARGADWIKLSYENQKSGQSLISIGASVPNSLRAHEPAASRPAPRLLRCGSRLLFQADDREKSFTASGAELPPPSAPAP